MMFFEREIRRIKMNRRSRRMSIVLLCVLLVTLSATAFAKVQDAAVENTFGQEHDETAPEGNVRANNMVVPESSAPEKAASAEAVLLNNDTVISGSSDGAANEGHVSIVEVDEMSIESEDTMQINVGGNVLNVMQDVVETENIKGGDSTAENNTFGHVENLYIKEQEGSTEDLVLSQEELLGIYKNIWENTDPSRLLVVMKAYELQGKVAYFWGGKSTAIGWDDRWGKLSYVKSEGSNSTGMLRVFGLDCSGYVNWVFNNAAGENVIGKMGDGTSNQWSRSTAVSWEGAKPGDLAFLDDPVIVQSLNHIGIVVGQNESGDLLVAHCSGSYNNVVITEAKSSGFKYIRTPNIYDDEAFAMSAAQNSSFIEYMDLINMYLVENEAMETEEMSVPRGIVQENFAAGETMQGNLVSKSSSEAVCNKIIYR